MSEIKICVCGHSPSQHHGKCDYNSYSCSCVEYRRVTRQENKEFHIKDDMDAVFGRAINDGRMPFLEAQQYMYMGTRYGVDTFKHVNTREYLK